MINPLSIKELLRILLKGAKIDIDEVLKDYEQMKREEILQHHPYAISYDEKNNRYFSYLYDETKPKNRRQIVRKNKQDIENLIIDSCIKTISKDMIFRDLYSAWLDYKADNIGTRKGQISPSTYRRYELDYERYIKGTPFDNMKIQKINAVEIEKFLKSMVIDNNLTQKCLTNIFGYIKGCFKFACKSEILLKNPTAYVELTRVIGFCKITVKNDVDRVLSKKEMKKLLKILHQKQNESKYYIQNFAIELATLTGMRVGELAGLKWECVTATELRIDYSEHRLDYKDKPCEYIIAEPKNRKHRVYPMTAEMKDLFRRIKEVQLKYGIKNEFVFADKNGRVNSHTITCAMSRRCNDAGIAPRSIHAIRRTVSSYLRTILPVATVANMLGHLEETNEKYYNYDIMENAEKIDCLSKMYSTFNNKKSYKKSA